MKLNELYNRWIEKEESIGDLAPDVADSADAILNEVGRGLASLNAESPGAEQEALAALSTLQRGLALLNAASTTGSSATPKILQVLSQRIQDLKGWLQKIQAASGATGFSISVGFPWGVTVSVNW